MADIYVSAAGSNTSPYDTWVKGATAFLSASALSAAGDNIYVNSTHNENTGGATTYAFPTTGLPVKVISTLVNTTTPTVGAALNTNGNFLMGIDGYVYMFGMTLSVGAGGNSASAILTLGSSNTVGQFQTYESCTFYANSTNTDSTIRFGTSAGTPQQGSKIIERNCQWRFINAVQEASMNMGTTEHYNTIFHASSTSPTTAIVTEITSGGLHWFSGCNFTGPTNLLNIANSNRAAIVRFVNCKTPATLTTGTAAMGGVEAYFEGCSASGDNNWEYTYAGPQGTVIADATVYFDTNPATTYDTGGETINYTLKFTPSATLCAKSAPLYGPWIHCRQASTGSKTVSLRVAHTESSVLTDSEVWLEVDYMGGAAATDVPQSQLEVSAPVVSGTLSRDVLAAGSNLTDTAVAVTGIASEKTHTLSKTVTFDEQGYFRARVGLGKVTTNPVYMDTFLTVS